MAFTCIFQAGYKITISWTKDGEPYNPHPSTSTGAVEESSYNSTLRIDSVGFDDCGRYTCTVGDVSSSADLGVVGEYTHTHTHTRMHARTHARLEGGREGGRVRVSVCVCVCVCVCVAVSL